MRAPKIAVLALLFVIAWAGSSYADVTVSPSSGPPGTVVTVSGITTCAGPTQPTVIFVRTDGGYAGFNRAVPFTPPSPATLVVPNVAEGEYRIVPNCGAMEAFYVFVVTPGFTG
jgi:hypothetical protein